MTDTSNPTPPDESSADEFSLPPPAAPIELATDSPLEIAADPLPFPPPAPPAPLKRQWRRDWLWSGLVGLMGVLVLIAVVVADLSGVITLGSVDI